jgi:hypothetical protein
MIRWPCITQCPHDTVLLRRAFIDRTGFRRDRGKSAQIPRLPPVILPPFDRAVMHIEHSIELEGWRELIYGSGRWWSRGQKRRPGGLEVAFVRRSAGPGERVGHLGPVEGSECGEGRSYRRPVEDGVLQPLRRWLKLAGG